MPNEVGPLEHTAAILELLKLPTGTPAENVSRQHKIDAIQKKLVAQYAALRGWKLAGKRFTATALAEGRVQRKAEHTRDPLEIENRSQIFDHIYRWTLDGLPVAITAHPYNYQPENHSELAAIVSARGLRLTVPDDFPSWWYPGRTTLVEITRA